MNSRALLSFIAIFILIYLGHFFFITRPYILNVLGKKKTKSKKRTKKEKQLGQIDYLCKKFKLNKDKLNYKELMYMIPLIDSFIITLVSLILDIIPIPFMFKLIIGFILLFGLIYALYEIYGRRLKKKERKD